MLYLIFVLLYNSVPFLSCSCGVHFFILLVVYRFIILLYRRVYLCCHSPVVDLFHSPAEYVFIVPLWCTGTFLSFFCRVHVCMIAFSFGIFLWYTVLSFSCTCSVPLCRYPVVHIFFIIRHCTFWIILLYYICSLVQPNNIRNHIVCGLSGKWNSGCATCTLKKFLHSETWFP